MSRDTLISNLKTLLNNKDGNISRTAGLILAVLEMDKSKQNLQYLIPGVDLTGFNIENGIGALSIPQIQDAVRKWLTTGLITTEDMSQVSSDEQDKNLLNQIAIIITSCVEGGLSKEICRDVIPELKDMKVQNVNLKLANATLTTLGFELNNNKFQTVEQWKQANSAVLDSISINSNLLEVLQIFVDTLNANPSDMTQAKLVPVNLNKEPSKPENMSAVILAINSEMDGMTFFQKYNAALLPIKAKNLGLVNMKGGALISYDKDSSGTPTKMIYQSYVDEQVDTRKNFYTSNVLSKYFEKLSSSLNKNGVKINEGEINTIKQQLTKLGEDEKKLANLSSTIEKYLALHKYWSANGKNEVPKADSVENIEKLLETHKEKFERVEKKRKGLGNILYVLAQRVDSFFF